MTQTQLILVALMTLFMYHEGAGYSEQVQCLGLLGNESSSSSLHSCSSRNLVLYRDTFCFPTEFLSTSEAFIHWISLLTQRIISNSSEKLQKSLYFAMWSSATRSGNLADENNTAVLMPDLPIVLAGAFKELVQYGSWRRVAVITDQSSILHVKLAETINRVLKESVDLYYTTLYNSAQDDIDNRLTQLVKLQYRVIVVVLSTKSLQELMCRRLALKMTWPEYAWIILGISIQPETKCLNESILFQYTLQQRNSERVIMLAKVLDISQQIITTCNISYLQDSYMINIYHYDHRLIYTTNYRARGALSAFNFTFLPSDEIDIKISLSWFIVFTIINLGVFIVLTVIVILYAVLRNTPEVKATSVPLTVYIFLGCYLLLAYSVVNSVFYTNLHTSPVFATIECFTTAWCNGISVPTGMILSVLLVKLVRVKFIFSHNKVLKKNWKCHNITLALYVFLLTLPLMVSSTLQAVWIQCTGYSEFYFLFSQLFYISMISITMVAVAIQTRKIEANNFKDTKKIVILMVTYIMTACLGLSYLFIFYNIDASRLQNSFVFILTHTSFILECIFFLFVPKYYTVFKRHF